MNASSTGSQPVTTNHGHPMLARQAGSLCYVALLLLLPSAAVAADQIEFLSGTKLTGKVTNIDKDGKKVTFESKIGQRTRRRVYSYSKIHAITFRGKRHVLTPKPAGAPSDSGSQRSRKEVNDLIQSVGSSPPDWLDSTRLNYPRTLDLSWPAAKSSQWNTQKHVGHFMWSVINENPSRWREGVKFMYHVISVNDRNPAARNRAMIELGDKYHNLFQDYARAAYWYREANVDSDPPRGNPGAPVRLAECYFRLGNKQMAVELLNKTQFRFEAIKLFANIGDLKKALQLADAAIRSRDAYTIGQACLNAGDGCRTAGKLDDAIRYYKKALTLSGGNHRIKRARDRAQASIAAIELFDASDVSQVADGSYRSSSLGYEGPVHVEVVVKSHRIESVKVTQHREKQFYAALKDTPAQIIDKQSVTGVDTTSRATITSEAIINATAKALAGK